MPGVKRDLHIKGLTDCQRDASGELESLREEVQSLAESKRELQASLERKVYDVEELQDQLYRLRRDLDSLKK